MNKRWLVVPLCLAIAARGSREIKPPPDAVTSCRAGDGRAVAYALTSSTGLDYWMTTGGTPIELGWGYDGYAACAIGKTRGRYLVAWGWADSWGGTPELRIAIVERGRRIETRKIASGGWEIHPVAVESRPYGWLVSYRDREDAPIQKVRIDYAR